MPIFSITDYRRATGCLGIASQMRSDERADDAEFLQRLVIAKFAIVNMPDELLVAMLKADVPVEYPTPRNLIKADETGAYFSCKDMPESHFQHLTVSDCMKAVLESSSWKDGYYPWGRLLSAAWHIMDVIDWIKNDFSMPPPDGTISDFTDVTHPSPDQLQAFLTRLQSLQAPSTQSVLMSR